MKIRLIRSFGNKVVVSAIFLVVLAILATLCTSYFISYTIVQDKTIKIKSILTDAVVNKTNAVLEEIEKIVDLSKKDSNIDFMINSKDIYGYEWVNAKIEYEVYLHNLIMQYDKIDALLLITDGANSFVTNNIDRGYTKYKDPLFFEKIQKRINSDITARKNEDRDLFYIDNYSDKYYERMVIISPIFRPYSQEISSCIIVILSDNFSKELNFKDNNVSIKDHTENEVELSQVKNITPQLLSNVSISPLFFKGWTIETSFNSTQYIGAIRKGIVKVLIFAVFCFILSILGAGILKRTLVKPIEDLSTRMKEYKADDTTQVKLRKLYGRISFKMKLTIFYCVLVAIPVITITYVFYTDVNKIIQLEVGDALKYNSTIATQQMDFMLKNYSRNLVEIENSEAIQNALQAKNENETIENKSNEIDNLSIKLHIQNKRLINIALFNKSNNLIYSSNYSKSYLTRPYMLNTLKSIKYNFSKPSWEYMGDESVNKYIIRLGMQVRRSIPGGNQGELLGYIVMDVDGSDIMQIMNRFVVYGEAKVQMINKSGQMLLDMPVPKNLITSSIQSRSITISNDLDTNNWKLVVSIPISEYLKDNRKFLQYNIITLFSLILLSFLFSIGFSTILVRNISGLGKVLQKVKEGKLNSRYQKKTGDEIEELGKNFNEMLDRLNLLMQEKLTNEIKAKDAEIKAREFELNLLQQQINPHFLYNTLKTAQYMVFAKDERAEKMIKLLIYLFKTGISSGKTLVTLQDEVNHVRAYIEIQEMRFSDRIKLNCNIKEELLKYNILKITLQPLVENAVLHGMKINEKRVHIQIDAKIENEKLKIQIRDDGIGIEPERLKEINEQFEGHKNIKSIGLTNVHERIQLYFGKEYGLKIESEKREGTVVTILLPLLEETL